MVVWLSMLASIAVFSPEAGASPAVCEAVMSEWKIPRSVPREHWVREALSEAQAMFPHSGANLAETILFAARLNVRISFRPEWQPSMHEGNRLAPALQSALEAYESSLGPHMDEVAGRWTASEALPFREVVLYPPGWNQRMSKARNRTRKARLSDVDGGEARDWMIRSNVFWDNLLVRNEEDRIGVRVLFRKVVRTAGTQLGWGQAAWIDAGALVTMLQHGLDDVPADDETVEYDYDKDNEADRAWAQNERRWDASSPSIGTPGTFWYHAARRTLPSVDQAFGRLILKAARHGVVIRLDSSRTPTVSEIEGILPELNRVIQTYARWKRGKVLQPKTIELLGRSPRREPRAKWESVSETHFDETSGIVQVRISHRRSGSGLETRPMIDFNAILGSLKTQGHDGDF